MRIRSRARELALQFLFVLDYQSDLEGTDLDYALDALLDEELHGAGATQDAIRETKVFARELVAGVRAHSEAIDALLDKAASNWELARMAGVDRNALRIGCYELLHADDVPTKVAINEAIELGKRYSTAQSGAFINGILDRIRKDQGLHA